MLRYAISDGSLALGQTRQNAATLSIPIAPALDPQTLNNLLVAQAEYLATQPLNFFLLREPTLAASQLAALSRDLLRIFAPTPTRLLIHSRADIAVATRAGGVHLPSTPGQLTPTNIRALYSSANLPPPTVSLSCHTERDLYRARILQPDLILFGPIFDKQIQGVTIHPGIGIEPLRQACLLAAPTPILALGGITEVNAPACLQAGAVGIAAIRLFSQPQIK